MEKASFLLQSNQGLHTLRFRFLLDVFLGGFRGKRLPSRCKAINGSTPSGLGFFWTCFLVGFVEKASFPLQSNQRLHTLRFRLLLEVFLGGFRGNGCLPRCKATKGSTRSGLGFFWTCILAWWVSWKQLPSRCIAPNSFGRVFFVGFMAKASSRWIASKDSTPSGLGSERMVTGR